MLVRRKQTLIPEAHMPHSQSVLFKTVLSAIQKSECNIQRTVTVNLTFKEPKLKCHLLYRLVRTTLFCETIAYELYMPDLLSVFFVAISLLLHNLHVSCSCLEMKDSTKDDHTKSYLRTAAKATLTFFPETACLQ